MWDIRLQNRNYFHFIHSKSVLSIESKVKKFDLNIHKTFMKLKKAKKNELDSTDVLKNLK